MVSLDIHAILTNPGIEECIFYVFQARTENDSENIFYYISILSIYFRKCHLCPNASDWSER